MTQPITTQICTCTVHRGSSSSLYKTSLYYIQCVQHFVNINKTDYCKNDTFISLSL